MKKLAVIFPGMGYTPDKPLLYYASGLAKERDFDIVTVDFRNLNKSMLKSDEQRRAAFESAASQAEERLTDVDFSAYGAILFISKSIGTIVAADYAAKNELPVNQIYFTPLERTLEVAKDGNGLVFFGDNDPWIEPAVIKDMCAAKGLEYKLIPNGNHSLETGHVHNDVENITEIMHIVEKYMDEKVG